MNPDMDVAQALAALRRFWSVLLIATLAGGGLGVVSVLVATPRYDAQVTLFFAVNRTETVNELAQGTAYTQDLVQSFVQLARTPVVLDPVVEDLGLDGSGSALARRVDVSAPAGTVLMEISVGDTSPERAARIADSVAAEVSATVSRLTTQAGAADSSVSVTALAPAQVPATPSSPRVPLNVAGGLLTGILVGGCLVLALGALRLTVSTREEVAALTGAPVVGMLPYATGADRERVPTVTAPHDAQAEAFRSLRTNVRFLQGARRCQVIVVTSATENEGKTYTAVNLAVSLADVMDRVLLVDADLRRPHVHASLGIEGAVGLSTVLTSDLGLDDAVQTWGSSGLHVMTSGLTPPNPSELIASEAMIKLVAEARGRYDTIVVDGAPVLPVTDSANLAALTDGALFVINGRRTPQRQVREGLTRVGIAGAETVGVVLNEVRVAHQNTYYRRTEAAAP